MQRYSILAKSYDIISSNPLEGVLHQISPVASSQESHDYMQSSLVLVHANDELISILPEAMALRAAIIKRTKAYIEQWKDIYYLPFLCSEKWIPRYLQWFQDRIQFVLTGDKKEVVFVSKQAEHVAKIAKIAGKNTLEVGWLYRYACVNTAASTLTKQGLEIIVNTDITNSPNGVFWSGGPLAGKFPVFEESRRSRNKISWIL